MRLIVHTSTAINNKMSLEESFERKEVFEDIHSLPLDSFISNNKEIDLVDQDLEIDITYDNEQGKVVEEKSQNTQLEKIRNHKESDKSDNIDINLEENKIVKSINLKNNLLQNRCHNNKTDEETNTSKAIFETESISTETIFATDNCSLAIENDGHVETSISSETTNESPHTKHYKKEKQKFIGDVNLEVPRVNRDELTENIEGEIVKTEHGNDNEKLVLNTEVIEKNDGETKGARLVLNLYDNTEVKDKNNIEAYKEKSIDTCIEEEAIKESEKKNIDVVTEENIESDIEENFESPMNTDNNLDRTNLKNISKMQLEINDDVAESIFICSENKPDVNETQQQLKDYDDESIFMSCDSQSEICKMQQALKERDVAQSKVISSDANKRHTSETQKILNESENVPDTCKMQQTSRESDIAESIFVNSENDPEKILNEQTELVSNIAEDMEKRHVSFTGNGSEILENLEENFNNVTNDYIKDEEEKSVYDVKTSELPTDNETAPDAVVEVMDEDILTRIKEAEPCDLIDKEISAETMDFENTVDCESTQEMSDKACSTAVESNKNSTSPIRRLSNTLNILSDNEDETLKLESKVDEKIDPEKLCINLEDADDIMFSEEDTNSKDDKSESEVESTGKDKTIQLAKTTNNINEHKEENIEADIEENINTDFGQHVEETFEAVIEDNFEVDMEENIESPRNTDDNSFRANVENISKTQQELNNDVPETILICSENKPDINEAQQQLKDCDNAESMLMSSENEPEICKMHQALKESDVAQSIVISSDANKRDISKAQQLLNESDDAKKILLSPDKVPDICKMQQALQETDVAESIFINSENEPEKISSEPTKLLLNASEDLEKGDIFSKNDPDKIPSEPKKLLSNAFEDLEKGDVSCIGKESVASMVSENFEKNISNVTNVHIKDEGEKSISNIKTSNLPTEKKTDLDADVEAMDVDVSIHVKETEPCELIEKESSVVKMDVNCDLTHEMSDQACPAAVVSDKNSTFTSPISRLSNTLNILSDDEDETFKLEQKVGEKIDSEKPCINLEEDDDIMFIEEDTNSKDGKSESKIESSSIDIINQLATATDCDKDTSTFEDAKSGAPPPLVNDDTEMKKVLEEKQGEKEVIMKLLPDEEEKVESVQQPLLTRNFLSQCKKNLADMTRAELEEFCVHKIVDSIIDRSSLSEIKSKLKTISQNFEEYKKKYGLLAKQNRDLQVILKSVQEEQKKKAPSVTPLKITRSVGMQIVMAEPNNRRKSALNTAPLINSCINAPVTQSRKNQNSRLVKQVSNPQIPVPRLVPASNSVAPKPPSVPQQPSVSNSPKSPSPVSQPNGVKNVTPQKVEKRPFNRTQSVTVDLTDDEPPPKVQARNSLPPVRMVPQQNLLKPQFGGQVNNPRKVYIPISGTQTQNIRPGQIMLKAVTPQGLRPRGPINSSPRIQAPVRITRLPGPRHPAPLPDVMKQYQPPNWKAIPPAPDLKLSKVENGIVISWKIEDYQEDQFEEIASYQLYAYQETTSPPNTNLWKKIGDVKALPLPMACTLTQFMAGYRYYFAVRAVDIRSRLGPFSLPGSILLLSKNMNGTTVGNK